MAITVHGDPFGTGTWISSARDVGGTVSKHHVTIVPTSHGKCVTIAQMSHGQHMTIARKLHSQQVTILQCQALSSFQLSPPPEHSAPQFLPGPVPLPWGLSSHIACHWGQPGPDCLLHLLPALDWVTFLSTTGSSTVWQKAYESQMEEPLTDCVTLCKSFTSLSLNLLIRISTTEFLK